MSGLFGQKPPKAPPPAPMPDDAELAKARRRKLAKAITRAGSRQSTILTDALG